MTRISRRKRRPVLYWLSSFLLYQCSTALVPPHPDSELAETWDRRRLRNHTYLPRFVHPELCRYMNDEECQDVDESLQDHAIRHRSLYEEPEPDAAPPLSFDDHIHGNNGFLVASSSSRSNNLRAPANNTTIEDQVPKPNPYFVAPNDLSLIHI